MTGTEPQFEHAKYEELCALATAGVLSPADSEMLFAHLGHCVECGEMFAQYQSIATDGMPFLADHFACPPDAESFDESSALTRLMEATERSRPQPWPVTAGKSKGHWWGRALVGGSVAASLLFGVGVASFRIGEHSKSAPAHGAGTELSAAFARIAAEKQTLEKTIQTDNELIAALEKQATGEQSETVKLRSEADTAAAHLAAMSATLSESKNQSDAQLAGLTQERDAAVARLGDAEKKYQTVQDELNTLRSQHQQDLLHVASLETRVDSLTVALNNQNALAKNDEQYLSSDKDIRDLIGARNLYIADIMDVDEGGQSRKPFGRVFYTRTKSLIFYAYDLDRQPGVRRTSTFQVWGRISTKDRNPVNLGMLYMDSETNRRWTLRVDNPQQLARLDSIFVTIEPREQSDKPTGKPFLYAALRREPNHP